MPKEKAEKYLVRVSMKADPFAIDDTYDSVILGKDLPQ